MRPPNALKVLAASNGLAQPLTAADLPRPTQGSAYTDYEPSIATSHLSNVPMVPAIPVYGADNYDWSTSQHGDPSIYAQIGFPSSTPSASPTNIITVSPTLLPAAPSASDQLDLGPRLGRKSLEDIGRIAKFYDEHQASQRQDGASVFGSDDSVSDVFYEATEQQAVATPVTSDNTIDASHIPVGLFEKESQTTGVVDTAVQTMSKGHDEVRTSGQDFDDAAKHLASTVGTKWSDFTSSPARTISAGAETAIPDKPREMAEYSLQKASSVASQVQSGLPDFAGGWQTKAAAVPSAVKQMATDTSQDVQSRLRSTVDHATSAVHHNLVEPMETGVVQPVYDTATDIHSHLPEPSSVANTAASAVGDFAQGASNTIDTVASEARDGKEYMHHQVDQVENAINSAASSVAPAAEAAQILGNYQKPSVEDVADSYFDPTPSRAQQPLVSPSIIDLNTSASLDTVESSPQTVTYAKPVANDPVPNSAFVSCGSGDTVNHTVDTSTTQIQPSFFRRVNGGLKGYGIDLSRLGGQTSTVAHEGYDATASAVHRGYDATTNALHNGYDNTAAAAARTYQGTAETASQWTHQLDQTASNLKQGFWSFFEPRYEMDTEPLEISAPVLTHTTVDPFLSLIPVQKVETAPAAPTLASLFTDVASGAGTDRTSGGWRSFLPGWKPKGVTTSVPEPTVTFDATMPSVTSTAKKVHFAPAPSTVSSMPKKSWWGSSNMPKTTTGSSSLRPSIESTLGSNPSKRPSGWTGSAINFWAGTVDQDTALSRALDALEAFSVLSKSSKLL